MSIALEQAISSFLLAKKAAGRSPRTIVKYRDILHALIGYTHGERLEDITSDDIRRYLADRRDAGHKPSSLDTYHRALATFFRWCATEYGTPNPMNRVERIKVPRKLPPYLSDETINKLIAAADHSRSPLRDRAIVLTLMDTGIRAGELVGLKMRDLDLEGGVIKVFGKDQEERVVPINLQACKALTLYLSGRSRHDDAPVFTSQQTGDALTTSGLLSILRSVESCKVVPVAPYQSFKKAYRFPSERVFIHNPN